MTDAVGAMRVRLRLQRPVLAPDDLGGGAISWLDEGEVWAAVSANGASLRALFDSSAAVVSYRVTINRLADVRVGWRALWGARDLRVTGVLDDGGARIDLICEEEKL